MFRRFSLDVFDLVASEIIQFISVFQDVGSWTQFRIKKKKVSVATWMNRE